MQATTGGIINPADGSRVTIAEAVNLGLIDRRMGQRIEKSEMGFRGFPERRTGEKLCLGLAMKKGLCYYDAGLRLLEYQYVTGLYHRILIYLLHLFSPALVYQ